MGAELPRKIDPSRQLAYGVRTLARFLDVGHDSIYAALRDGCLRAKRYGKRTLIPLIPSNKLSPQSTRRKPPRERLTGLIIANEC